MGDDFRAHAQENPFSDPTEAPSPGDAAPASLDVPPAETASGSGGIGSGGGGFFKPLSPKGARGTKVGAPAGAPSGGSGNSGGSFGPASAGGGNSSNDLQRREQALERREAELKRREEELRRNGGGKVKNWPRCYPLIYHDIEGEIPDEYQKMVKVCTRPAERRQRQFNHNRGPRREVEMAVGGNASVRRRM